MYFLQDQNKWCPRRYWTSWRYSWAILGGKRADKDATSRPNKEFLLPKLHQTATESGKEVTQQLVLHSLWLCWSNTTYNLVRTPPTRWNSHTKNHLTVFNSQWRTYTWTCETLRLLSWSFMCGLTFVFTPKMNRPNGLMWKHSSSLRLFWMLDQNCITL